MSDYFRDHYQGAGAIAAFGPAPRTAPAPTMRMIRPGLGAIRIDDDGGSSGGGEGPAPVPGQPWNPPPRTGVRNAPRVPFTRQPPPRQPRGGEGRPKPPFGPPKGGEGWPKPPTPPPRSANTGAVMAPVMVRYSVKAAAPKAIVTTGVAAVTTPITKSAVAAAKSASASASGGGGGGGGGGGLSMLEPPDDGPDIAIQENATTAVAPPGGAKVWLVIGGASAVAYVAYRLLRKKRPRR